MCACVCCLQVGPWVLQGMVGTTPVIMGRKLETSYFTTGWLAGRLAGWLAGVAALNELLVGRSVVMVPCTHLACTRSIHRRCWCAQQTPCRPPCISGFCVEHVLRPQPLIHGGDKEFAVRTNNAVVCYVWAEVGRGVGPAAAVAEAVKPTAAGYCCCCFPCFCVSVHHKIVMLRSTLM